MVIRLPQSYNYDTIIIGLAILVNSIFGLPWLCAATVRSVNHLNALAERDASGKIVSVQQTRLTHLGIHVLVLITLFSMQVRAWIEWNPRRPNEPRSLCD